jgi:CHAT domain-containing protein
MRTRIASLALGVAVAVLNAPPVHAQRSLDEAIKIIDQFRAPAAGSQDSKTAGAPAPVSFVPPPRTIADITAILDKEKPDPARRAAAQAAAEKQPPAGASPADLANFYYQRGVAAGELGRAEQRLADIKLANENAQKANFQPSNLNIFVQQLGFAYQGAGDTKAAIAAHQSRIPIVDRGNIRGAFFNIYQQIAILSARNGNLELARDIQAKAEKLLNETGTWRVSDLQRTNFRVQVLRTRAAIAQETGHYAEAEAAIREAAPLSSSLIGNEALFGIPAGQFSGQRDNISLDLARALLRQSRLVEAEAEVRRSLLDRLQHNGRYAAETAQDMGMLANVLFEQGRYAEAEKMAEATRDTLENIGHGKGSFALAGTRRLLAMTQSAQGKRAETRATYEALERDIAGNDELRRQFLDANVNYAVTLLQGQRGQDALRILTNVVQKEEKNLGEKAYATAQARGWLAVALARTGQSDRAAKEFEFAIPIMTSASREADDNDNDGSSVAQRDVQAQMITESYLGLLADTRGGGAAVEAFHLAEAVRGRSVERALAASSARATASDPALADLVRHEQDAQKQAAALQGLLTNILSQPTSEQDPGALKKLRQDIDLLRGARARVREEIERRFPDYANLVSPRPATVEQAQKSLRPGEALITTYAGTDRLFVWAIPQQGPAAFASTKISDGEVEKMVVALRKALDPNASTLDDVPEFDVGLAHKLYEMLLKPVEAGWANAQSLMIVPHKALGQLPMGLLVTAPYTLPPKSGVPFANYKGVPFLVRKVAVTQLPSVASLATLRALPPPKGQRQMFVGFGDPWFSAQEAQEARAETASSNAMQTRGVRPGGLQTRGIPLLRRAAPKTEGVDSADLAQLPRLPDTAEEIRTIAMVLHADVSKDVLLGADANEKTVKTMDLSNRRIIVFATHGLVPGDLNGLNQPALALSSPSVANIDGDGLLTMEEILGLRLNADWVVLSACNTATGAGAGAEAISGLGRAFFYAGTRALLVSNWPVETTSARTLTTDLFRRQAENATLARGEALRQAELALLDGPGFVDPSTKQPVFAYAHPIFWAPFTVVGDGGATTQ